MLLLDRGAGIRRQRERHAAPAVLHAMPASFAAYWSGAGAEGWIEEDPIGRNRLRSHCTVGSGVGPDSELTLARTLTAPMIQYLWAPDSASLRAPGTAADTKSIPFWIGGHLWPSPVAAVQYVVSKQGGVTAATLEYRLQLNTTYLLQWNVSDGATAPTRNSVALTPSAWNRFDCIYDGTRLGVWVNAVAPTAGNFTAWTTGIRFDVNPFRVGAGNGAPPTVQLGSFRVAGLHLSRGYVPTQADLDFLNAGRTLAEILAYTG